MDWHLPLPYHEDILAPMVAQGITTVVAGNCGHSPAPVTDASIPLVEHAAEILKDGDLAYPWRSMGEFLSALEGRFRRVRSGHGRRQHHARARRRAAFGDPHRPDHGRGGGAGRGADEQDAAGAPPAQVVRRRRARRSVTGRGTLPAPDHPLRP
ncbi:hypothetical protein [Sorangium sp. So ce406]|uniref:hypothetical protein n=1 Tax=Sorangium sp. So ce406 TaxID=3133311 RepID=UPI003F5AEFD6